MILQEYMDRLRSYPVSSREMAGVDVPGFDAADLPTEREREYLAWRDDNSRAAFWANLFDQHAMRYAAYVLTPILPHIDLWRTMTDPREGETRSHVAAFVRAKFICGADLMLYFIAGLRFREKILRCVNYADVRDVLSKPLDDSTARKFHEKIRLFHHQYREDHPNIVPEWSDIMVKDVAEAVRSSRQDASAGIGSPTPGRAPATPPGGFDACALQGDYGHVWRKQSKREGWFCIGFAAFTCFAKFT